MNYIVNRKGNVIKYLIKASVKILLKHLYSERIAIIYDINKEFKSLYNIKNASWEKNCFPEVFRVNKSFYGEYYVDQQDILDVPNAIVSDNSDIIVCEKGVLWDKCYQENFSLITPLDRDLLDYGEDFVIQKKQSVYRSIGGKVITLVGVHSTIWSHFLVQFLPKLYYAAESGLLDKDVTLLLPSYKDSQIRQILSDFIKNYPSVHVETVHRNKKYKCEHLLWIPTSSYLANTANFIHPSSIVIPEKVVQLLIKYLRDSYIVGNNNQQKINNRLYLVRRGKRSPINVEEIESFFKSEGFYFVDPAKLKIDEKARLFSQADIIAGPLSSGFTNVIFCKPGVKILQFTNYSRTMDTYVTLFHYMKADMIYVTGKETDGGIHSDFYIPSDRIRDSYNYLMNR